MSKTFSEQEVEVLKNTHQETGVPRDILEEMMKHAQKGGTVATFFGVTDETAAVWTNIGVDKYNQKHYRDAEHIALFVLNLTEGMRFSAWRLLAACRQADGDFKRAMDCYENAIELNPDDSLSRRWRDECKALHEASEHALRNLRSFMTFPAPVSYEDHTVQFSNLTTAYIDRAALLLKKHFSDEKRQAEEGS